ncbi:MAG: sulfatase-like hydrolase/transferase [Clostridia bacterium]|nr:sulfatase-like hydrolase/transferase [Clostridia bacterium]
MKTKWLSFKTRFGAVVSPILFAFVLFALDFLFRVVYRNAGIASFGLLAPNTFSLCWSILLTAIALIMPGILQKIFMSVVLAISAILPLVHAVIYNVTGSFLSFSDLAFAEDGVAFMSIAYLGIPWPMYVFTVLISALGIIAILLAPKKQSYQPVKLVMLGVLTAAGISTIAALNLKYDLTLVTKKFTWLDTYDPNSLEAAYTDFTNANNCLTFCGNTQYAVHSLVKSVRESLGQKEMIASLDSYYAAHQRKYVPNEMTGFFKGKNVICILGESIDTWMVNEKIMPNLYALQRHSIDFTDHYTPLFLSAGTFNTEFALNCGYYLPVSGTTARTYATNVYPQSLANVFRANGYTANSYHQLEGHHYNREVVHLVWGYESYNDLDDLKFQGSKYCDTSLMEPVSYGQIVHDEPFVSYLITYSGHGPYRNTLRSEIAAPHLSKAREIAPLTGARQFTDDEDTWEQYVRAIAHAMETDTMIGMLVDNMTRDGHIDDTVILFFGDHYSKYLTDIDFIMQMKGVRDSNEVCRTPFFIYSKDLESYMPVDKVTASADMLPTLLNLMGFKYDPTYYAGADAFSDYGGFVAFRDYSWYDGETWYSAGDPNQAETPEIMEKSRKIQEWLNASWDTIKTNYFAEKDLQLK